MEWITVEWILDTQTGGSDQRDSMGGVAGRACSCTLRLRVQACLHAACAIIYILRAFVYEIVTLSHSEKSLCNDNIRMKIY